jgi:hypothetical protein
MNLVLRGLVELENNVNFRNDLIISYLIKLVSLDNREEFEKYYQSVEHYIESMVSNCKDIDILNNIRDIITYKTKVIEMNI